ncbi:MAG TPA: AI-2E family transporter, partial [Microthrixaceae bacterium]|nr:AI-2E family transporter [Microthrixaceae bacterium]
MSTDPPVWARGSGDRPDQGSRAGSGAEAVGSELPARPARPDGPDVRPVPDPGPLLVDLDWRSVAVVAVMLVALTLTVAAVRTASIGVTLIVVSLFLALALDPMVRRVQDLSIGTTRARPDTGSPADRRSGSANDEPAGTVPRHLGRGTSVLLVVAVVAAAFAAFVAFAGPQLVTQTRQLGDDLPRTVDSLRDIPVLGPHLVDWGVPKRITEFVASLPAKIGEQDADLGGLAKGVGFGLGAFVLGALLTVGALLDGPRLVETIRSAIPARQRDRATDIGRIVDSVIGRYFAGSLLIALLNGIWVAIWALVAGAPLSPVLAVWAALTSLIPQIGGLMGFAVILVVSLAAGLVPAVVMAVAFLFFMLLTNHVLQPTIVGRAVELSAPVTMLAAISGFTVGGVVGALFAVPTVGAIKAVVVYVRNPEHALPVGREHTSRFSVDAARRWWHA